VRFKTEPDEQAQVWRHEAPASFPRRAFPLPILPESPSGRGSTPVADVLPPSASARRAVRRSTRRRLPPCTAIGLPLLAVDKSRTDEVRRRPQVSPAVGQGTPPLVLLNLKASSIRCDSFG
jgi:hypothetical protein